MSALDERQQSSTAYPVQFQMLSTTDGSVMTTLAAGDITVTLSKEGAGTTYSATAIGGAAGAGVTARDATIGLFEFAGNATDRNTIGTLLIKATATGARGDTAIAIVEHNPHDLAASILNPPIGSGTDYDVTGSLGNRIGGGNLSELAQATELAKVPREGTTFVHTNDSTAATATVTITAAP